VEELVEQVALVEARLVAVPELAAEVADVAGPLELEAQLVLAERAK
jgi:hypothetical protein